MFSNGMDSMADALQEIEDGLTSINDRLNVNLNKDLKGRVTGDNPDDMSTKFYGNGNVNPIKKSESHGTHVAGIIASITRHTVIGFVRLLLTLEKMMF